MTMFRAKWIGALGMVALAAVVVHAGETLRVRPLPHGDQVYVSFEVVDGYNKDVRDAIASGLRTTFSYQVELRTVARLWLDRAIATVLVSTSDRYDNLTRRHALERRVDGRIEASVVTEDENVVRRWLTSVERFTVCSTSKLDPNRDYYVRISASVLPNHTSVYGWTSAIIGQAKFTFIP
jgi:Domain of unknown function (DUF4390)